MNWVCDDFNIFDGFATRKHFGEISCPISLQHEMIPICLVRINIGIYWQGNCIFEQSSFGLVMALAGLQYGRTRLISSLMQQG
jgi:hypothetical protein